MRVLRSRLYRPAAPLAHRLVRLHLAGSRRASISGASVATKRRLGAAEVAAMRVSHHSLLGPSLASITLRHAAPSHGAKRQHRPRDSTICDAAGANAATDEQGRLKKTAKE